MDAKTTRGICLLPSKGHASDRLPTFLKWALKSGTSTPGLILVEQEDFIANREAYDALVLPQDWRVVICPGSCTAETTEYAYQTFCKDLDWFIWVTDDQRPETPNWDVRTVANLTGSNWVSTNDAMLAPKRAHGALAFSGDVVRAVGWFYPPGLKHFLLDDVWEEIGKLTGTWTVDMSVLLTHDHDMVTGRMDQMTSAKNAFWPNDIPAFQRLKTDGTIRAASERILEMLRSKGAVIASHDATGRKIMLGVPSADRMYPGAFMNAYVATRDAVRQLGGELVLAEMPWCAEVDLARDKLFAHFRDSDSTDLLLIDDDMGWRPEDVLRLMSYKLDFVAVAGPRKVHPPSYAVTSQDDLGNPLPIRVDGPTGLLEVTGVGMAFVLMSKHCAVRMCQHYADLTYVTADGRDVVGVFMPMIINKRRRSEDFAWCQRARAIGIKIMVDPNISLQHLGTFVWEGSWMKHLETMQRAQEAAA